MFVRNLPSTSPVPGLHVMLGASGRPPTPGIGDLVCGVGLSNRGPVNQPLFVPNDDLGFKMLFGGMVASGTPNTPLSMYPDFLVLKKLGVTRKLFMRVGDNTVRTSYLHLLTGGSKIVALRASSPGTWATNLSGTISNVNTTAFTFDLTITDAATGQQDVLRSLPYNNVANLVAAINTGIAGVSPKAQLVVASLPVIDSPTAAPTVVINSAAGGTLPTGNYKVLASYLNASGESLGSPSSTTQAVTLGDTLTVSLPSLSGAVGVAAYITPLNGAAGSEVYAAQNAAGLSVTVTAPATSNKFPPVINTATVAGTTGAPAAGGISWPTVNGTGTQIGADGVSATSAQHVGVAGNPDTGLSRIASVFPKPDMVFLCGAAGTDTSTWTAQAQIAADNGWFGIGCLPLGSDATTGAAALSALSALKASYTGKFFYAAMGGGQFTDNELYNALLTFPSQAALAGIWAVQNPKNAAGNKEVSCYEGTELTVGDSTRLATIIQAGGNPLVGNIEAGGIGFLRGIALDGTEGADMRLTMLAIKAIKDVAGQWPQNANEPTLWATVEAAIIARFNFYVGQNIFPANVTGVTPGASSTSPVTVPASTKAAAGQSSNAGGTVPGDGSAVVASDNGGVGWYVQCDANTNIVNGQITDRLRIRLIAKWYPQVVGVDVFVEAGSGIPDVQPLNRAA